MQSPASDAASPKEECEKLMTDVLPFAEKMLKEHGEFYPYGGAMRPSGEIVYVAGYDGTEHPPSMEVIKLIREGFIQSGRSGEYKATALIYDVRVVLPNTGQKSDAIAVSLNHKANYSVVVFFPYQLREGVLNVSEPFAERGAADVF